MDFHDGNRQVDGWFNNTYTDDVPFGDLVPDVGYNNIVQAAVGVGKTSESSPTSAPALSEENKPQALHNKHDPKTPETAAEKQEYLHKLMAAFKNLKQCEAKETEVKFIKEASDDKVEAWCQRLLDSIIQRHKKASPFFAQKQRAGCEHSKEYAKFQARFAAVEETLKIEKRACYRFSTMSGKGWMDRLADDPVFERDAIVLNDNGNTFRGLRDQNVRGNNKVIFEYLQKLGDEGILAGDEYENILRLAKYNVAPAKSERKSRTNTASKRKRSHDQDTEIETGSSQLGSQLGRSRSVRKSDGAGLLDADIETSGSTAIPSKRMKFNNVDVGPSYYASNAHTKPHRAVQNFAKSARRPHSPSQHPMVRATAGSVALTPAHSLENIQAEHIMQRHPLPLAIGASSALMIQGQHKPSQKTESQYVSQSARNLGRQHSMSFHQYPQTFSAMERHNHDHRSHPSGLHEMQTATFSGPAQSPAFPSLEESDAPTFDEFDEFINY